MNFLPGRSMGNCCFCYCSMSRASVSNHRLPRMLLRNRPSISSTSVPNAASCSSCVLIDFQLLHAHFLKGIAACVTSAYYSTPSGLDLITPLPPRGPLLDSPPSPAPLEMRLAHRGFSGFSSSDVVGILGGFGFANQIDLCGLFQLPRGAQVRVYGPTG